MNDLYHDRSERRSPYRNRPGKPRPPALGRQAREERLMGFIRFMLAALFMVALLLAFVVMLRGE